MYKTYGSSAARSAASSSGASYGTGSYGASYGASANGSVTARPSAAALQASIASGSATSAAGLSPAVATGAGAAAATASASASAGGIAAGGPASAASGASAMLVVLSDSDLATASLSASAISGTAPLPSTGSGDSAAVRPAADTPVGAGIGASAGAASSAASGSSSAPCEPGDPASETNTLGNVAATNPRSRSFVETTDSLQDQPADASESNRHDPASLPFISGYATQATDEEGPPDGNVTITYTAGEGGSVSNGFDVLDALTGRTPGADSSSTSGNAHGSVATPYIGYHFTGWTIDGKNPADPDDSTSSEPIYVCDKLSLGADKIKQYSLSPQTDTYGPVSFKSNFAGNTYVLNYEPNGASSDSSSLATPTLTTFGQNDTVTSTNAPVRDGYEFIGWNTDANGTGVFVRDGATLTTNLLRAMVLESPIADADGAQINLFARWKAADAAPTLVDPGAAVVPSVPERPFIQTTVQPTNPTGSSASMQSVSRGQSGIAASSAFDRAPAAPSAGAAEAAAEAAASIGEGENALGLPPALEVLPAAAEHFTTVSAAALTGVAEGGEGLADAIANMTPAQATQAAATVAVAAGAIALAVGVAGASSTAAARRRIARTLRDEMLEQ